MPRQRGGERSLMPRGNTTDRQRRSTLVAFHRHHVVVNGGRLCLGIGSTLWAFSGHWVKRTNRDCPQCKTAAGPPEEARGRVTFRSLINNEAATPPAAGGPFDWGPDSPIAIVHLMPFVSDRCRS
uniref:Integrase_H2C2 domain-containing protein n=1 Tax=Panagrellus redivivus TaxID=6233 RepID=A0A7E4WC39_PANRE